LDKGALITGNICAAALLSAWAINYAKNTISASAPFSQINLIARRASALLQNVGRERVKN